MSSKSILHNDNVEVLVDKFANYAKEQLAKQATKFATNFEEETTKIHSVSIDSGVGAEAAFNRFCRDFDTYLSGSAGPNYFGFVTGGSTPAGLVGDWRDYVFICWVVNCEAMGW